MTRAARPSTWRFALLPAFAVAALTCVLLGFEQRLLGAELIERSLVSNQQRADVLGLQLQLALRDAVSQVRLLARSPLLRPGASPERARAELDQLVERSPRFVWAGLVGMDGQVIAGSRGWLEGASIAQRPVFKRGKDGMVGDVHEPVTLAPLMARLPGGVRELIDIGEPVLDDAGEVVGVVAVHLGLDWVNEQLALSLGEPADAAAQGLRGLVLTEPGARNVAPTTIVPAGLPPAHPKPQRWRADDGEAWLLAQSALRGLGSGDAPLLPWRAVVLQREDVALAPLHQLTSSMLWVGVAAALLLAAAGFWAARRLLTPWGRVFDSALADAAVDTLLATLDMDGHVLEWSRGAAQLSGHAPADAMGRKLDTLLPGFDGCAAWMGAAQIDGWCELRVLGRTPDGRERRFEGALYALGVTTGSARFGLILRDVSERAAQARLIEVTRDELTQLNRRLLDQEKRTSRRLAQSLHDELGQTLAALRLHWEAWRGATAEQRERMDERIANLIVLANRQVRGVLAEMRPPLLDELGLAAAIDNEIRQHQGGDGEARIELQASEAAQQQRWPADIEYAVFMIAREALLNAMRHAGAQAITVSLEGDEGQLELAISDDGQGFQAGTGRPGHLGLIGMRERALAIGADLHIDGRPGRGTMVALTWDATDEADADEPHLPDR